MVTASIQYNFTDCDCITSCITRAKLFKVDNARVIFTLRQRHDDTLMFFRIKQYFFSFSSFSLRSPMMTQFFDTMPKTKTKSNCKSPIKRSLRTTICGRFSCEFSLDDVAKCKAICTCPRPLCAGYNVTCSLLIHISPHSFALIVIIFVHDFLSQI